MVFTPSITLYNNIFLENFEKKIFIFIKMGDVSIFSEKLYMKGFVSYNLFRKLFATFAIHVHSSTVIRILILSKIEKPEKLSFILTIESCVISKIEVIRIRI
jgi:hypothetical protein